MLIIKTIHSPIGQLLLADRDGQLVGLWMVGQKYFPTVFPEDPVHGDSPLLRQTEQWLQQYFAGEQPEISELPLAPSGSEFRQEVWRILCRIPYGKTITYGNIAQEMAQHRGLASMSAQAVGGAVGHNPISIIIPCHRVVGSSGSLTGYAGGLERKKWLLEWEQKG